MLYEYYKAARESAAILEQDWLGALRLTGPDRTSWLQGMVTNDVAKLSPGQGCYAAHLNAQGKLVGQMNILVEPDALWIVTERTSIANLAAAFDKLIIMEDVQVQNVSDEYEVLGVLGLKSREVLESWLGEPLNLQEAYAHRRASEHHIVRSELGYDIWVRQDLTDKTLRAIAASGATAIDHGTWDVLRTEAGLPLYGVDIDESTTLPELGERGISYDKGCYIGQEVVARVKYIGHVNRKFMGFLCNPNELPEIRSKVRVGDKEVGYITTSLVSPGLDRPIALGFVNRAAATPGTAVELVGAEKKVTAQVAALPFIPPVGAA